VREGLVGLRQVLLQETIRAVALGYVVFVFVGLGRNNLGLSGHQVMTVSGLATLGIFLTFTAIRLKTGRELMARTRREWTVVGMVAAIVVAGSIGVAAIVGQLPRVLGWSPLSVVVAVLVLILFTWLGYLSAKGRR
jgi:phosphatidylserine synthase